MIPNIADMIDCSSGNQSIENLNVLYSNPLPASRGGVLYNSFSYPTKISPESIAVFIASHTRPGDTVLDTFGGTGTTGLAVKICDNPTPDAVALAEKIGAPVVWGPRNAEIYELSVLGSFVADTMCNPPDPKAFLQAAINLISSCEERIGSVYSTIDDVGQLGIIRHIIWSDVLICHDCGHEVSFWDATVVLTPLSIKSTFICPCCGKIIPIGEVERVYDTFYDELTQKEEIRRKRIIKRIYGQTGKRKWYRDPVSTDESILHDLDLLKMGSSIPVVEIPWGDLHRSGYHKGITHAHHFYTRRNLIVIATLWEQISEAPKDLQAALKLLVLSYNSTHATLMSRVVVKSGQKDFVLTGAQSGVLYISSLPVEKNIFEGLRRKVKTIAAAFASIAKSTSSVNVIQGSSTTLNLPDKSIDYVFTDPPFGDYIPYSELNFLNEVWLGETTDTQEEIIISPSQKKSNETYGAMMTQVFKEISRTLKDDGKATVVFHSSKPEVWDSLQDAYHSAGLSLELSSVLDKLQGSFKQVSSSVTVKGDPILLLSKKPKIVLQNLYPLEVDDVINRLVKLSRMASDRKEHTPERLYTRFVSEYLKHSLTVPMNASEFYHKIKPLLEGYNAACFTK